MDVTSILTNLSTSSEDQDEFDWFHFTLEIFLIVICVVTIVMNLCFILAISTQLYGNDTTHNSKLIGFNLGVINFLVGVCGKSL